MKNVLSATLMAVLFFSACNPSANAGTEKEAETTTTSTPESDGKSTHWKGAFSNGMKGATISFDVDGKELKELTFQGYWRCEGKLDLTTLGPGKSFSIKGNKVDGTIIESGFYYELHGTFNGRTASGTLRIAYTGLGCDTYKLNWTAERQ